MAAQVLPQSVVPEEFVVVFQVLSSEQRRQVFDFAEFLAGRSEKSPDKQCFDQPKRCRDLDKGAVIWMGEDFDEPLPYEFWYGENDPLMIENVQLQQGS